MAGIYYDVSKPLDAPTLFLQRRGVVEPATSMRGSVYLDGVSWQGSTHIDAQAIADNLSESVNENLDLIRSIRGVPAIVCDTARSVYFTRGHICVKPLHYVCEPDQGVFAVSSSTQDLQQQHGNFAHVLSNRIYVYDKHTGYIDVWPYHEFSLSQINNTWDDVYDCWQHAVAMSHAPSAMYMLSSGIESGLLCAEARAKFGDIRVCYMHVHGNEDRQVLKQRFKLHNVTFVNRKDVDYTAIKQSMQTWAEHTNDTIMHSPVYENAHAKFQGVTRIIQGIGADAPFADHGIRGFRTRNWSMFGGVFPQNLLEQFPWYFPDSGAHAQPDVQWGMYGYETCAPFMDLDLMQSFMNVRRELKNANYKNWETLRLDQLEYPYSLTKAGIWDDEKIIEIKG